MYIYSKISLRGLGARSQCVGRAFGRCRQLARKHRYLPHGSHFGARNGCWGLLGCCQCARRSCSGLLRCRQCARNGRSGLLRCCRCARKGCSGLLWRCQCPQNGRSRRLCFHQCAQKDCSTPFRCRQCVQSGCSRITIQLSQQVTLTASLGSH